MKLYYAPGACSLADHIALHEAGLDFVCERVDLKAKRTESGADYAAINPKGYVPALVLDGGELLTENVAILDWIAGQAPQLAPRGGPIGRTRLLEVLAYISTEIHKGFKPFFAGAGDDEKAKAAEQLGKRFAFLSDTLAGDYVFGAEFSVADAYLFVMLTWAEKNAIPVPGPLAALRDRVRQRPAVQKALAHEAQTEPA